MNRYTAERQAIALMKIHGLWDQGWRFGWMNAKKINGMCYGARKQIKLSTVFVDGNGEDRVGLTMLHEIAHALVGVVHGHDHVWQAKCLEIGGDGKRCGQSEAVVSYAWHGTCPLCGKVTKQHRAPLRVKACGSCTRVYKPEAILVWAQYGRRMPLGSMPVRYVREALSLKARYGDRVPV